MSETEDEKTKFVQLRLPAELGRTLAEEGAKANRKLPSEIIFRLQQGAGTAADTLLYGWVDPERNKTLGEAIGFLASRLEIAGPMTDDRDQDRANALGMLKLAIGDVLDYLGADISSLSEDEKNFAALEARKFTNELRRPQASPHSVGPRPDLELLSRLAHGEPNAGHKARGHK